LRGSCLLSAFQVTGSAVSCAPVVNGRKVAQDKPGLLCIFADGPFQIFSCCHPVAGRRLGGGFLVSEPATCRGHPHIISVRSPRLSHATSVLAAQISRTFEHGNPPALFSQQRGHGLLRRGAPRSPAGQGPRCFKACLLDVKSPGHDIEFWSSHSHSGVWRFPHGRVARRWRVADALRAHAGKEAATAGGAQGNHRQAQGVREPSKIAHDFFPLHPPCLSIDFGLNKKSRQQCRSHLKMKAPQPGCQDGLPRVWPRQRTRTG